MLRISGGRYCATAISYATVAVRGAAKNGPMVRYSAVQKKMLYAG